MARPTREELAQAVERTIPDVIEPGLDVLFVGINPGLYSGATGHHFARPGNRFWRAIHLAGFTPQVLVPSQQAELLRYGLGVTNLVSRTTATAAQLSDDELRAGAEQLIEKIQRYRPGAVGLLGVSTYRTAFNRSKALVGRQAESIGSSEVWVLPNPSGLNAHYQLPQLAEAYGQLRAAVERANG